MRYVDVVSWRELEDGYSFVSAALDTGGVVLATYEISWDKLLQYLTFGFLNHWEEACSRARNIAGLVVESADDLA